MRKSGFRQTSKLILYLKVQWKLQRFGVFIPLLRKAPDDKRIKEHNSGKTKSTKGYKLWKLVYFETFETRDEAVLREKYFKTGSGREFLKGKLIL